MATDNKYDRQLRLWGAAGQKALAEAHVLLLGAGPAGTETLKNLVLPGVGRFTVVDGATVSEKDAGNNFFVRAEDVGRPRAAATAELLAELNPDASGAHRVADPAELLATEPQYVDGFTLVVAAQLAPEALQTLGELCWAANVPLVACRSYGLLGVVRLQVRCLEIVESKPDNVVWDLRLREPFPELEAAANALDLDALDDHAHAHVPWVLILAKAAAAWRAAHGGASPSTKAEKDEFRKAVASMARVLQSNVPEMNFEEAEREAYRAWADPRELPWEAQEAFDASKQSSVANRRGSDASAAAEAPPSTTTLALRAVAQFRAANGGLPPLAGAVPDMHADTQSFVALQKLYAERARLDLGAVAVHFDAIVKAARGAAPSSEDVEHLQLVCKHVRDVRRIVSKSLADELAAPELGEAAMSLFEIDDDALKPQAPVCWYAALRACDRFFVKRGRWPGTADALDADAAAVADELRAFVAEAGAADALGGALSEKHAAEATRWGASELHAVAAVVGGVASQEAVKVIAQQYTPVNHTYLFNGVSATAAVLEV